MLALFGRGFFPDMSEIESSRQNTWKMWGKERKTGKVEKKFRYISIRRSLSPFAADTVSALLRSFFHSTEEILPVG